jgi:hypothetical protein
MKIKDLHFVQTCSACPEQYDVFDKEGAQVGYVRLRWGNLTCEYPDCGGIVVYETSFNDGLQGCFANEDDRQLFLEEIANAIHRYVVKSASCPIKKVLCVDNFNNGTFGFWRAGHTYDIVTYDQDMEEWHIKDHDGDVGIVDEAEFKEYFDVVGDRDD